RVVFGGTARPAGGRRVVRRPGDQQACRRVEQPAGRELQRHRAAPHQRGIERGTRGLHPRVQTVDPARAPGHVGPGQDRGADDDDRNGQGAHSPPSTLPAAATTAWYTFTTSWATTGQS